MSVLPSAQACRQPQLLGKKGPSSFDDRWWASARLRQAWRSAFGGSYPLRRTSKERKAFEPVSACRAGIQRAVGRGLDEGSLTRVLVANLSDRPFDHRFMRASEGRKESNYFRTLREAWSRRGRPKFVTDADHGHKPMRARASQFQPDADVERRPPVRFLRVSRGLTVEGTPDRMRVR
jgi:hypothetical protein